MSKVILFNEQSTSKCKKPTSANFPDLQPFAGAGILNLY